MDLDKFFLYCDEVKNSKEYASYIEDDCVWNEERNNLYFRGVIPGLYNESSPELMKVLKQPCDHSELVHLLCRHMKERDRSYLFQHSIKNGTKEALEGPKEPLASWIANNEYTLTEPLCKTKEEVLKYPDPERLLTYVYVTLKYKYRQQPGRYLFRQPHIEEIYQGYFDKSSVFKSWGLIPLDYERKLFAEEYPVRIYDRKVNKTIFLDEISQVFAKTIYQLLDAGYIQKAAFRGSNLYIYDGENHASAICHLSERGSVFSWNVRDLKRITKLYSEPNINDSLWIHVEDEDMTFEELCDDFHYDGEDIVTQVIHLQYHGNVITHIDHEYIFYDSEKYVEREKNPYVKGDSRKRVKTFKIDDARIPMDFPCKIGRGIEEIEVPFIFFTLNAYFEHKDLLKEYFQNILKKDEI